MNQPPDPLCAECGIPLSPDEAYCCDDCSLALLLDPNFDMSGDDDE
jgi:predicted nucleic acid-binding Zn ribbon protein